MLLLRLGGHRARPFCGRLRPSWLRCRLCFGGLAIIICLPFSAFVWSRNVLIKEVVKKR